MEDKDLRNPNTENNFTDDKSEAFDRPENNDYAFDIKDCFSQNLIKYRKALNLTQAELAEKLNYSDKAVSKWERAESIPDIYTLKSIADFFGIKVDAIISEPKNERPKVNYNLGTKRTILCLASAAIVWLVAVLFYFFIHLFVDIKCPWLSYIYAVPITAIVLLVFTAVWGKSLGNLIIISLLIWTLLAAIYITLIVSLSAPPKGLWELFLIGIPAEGVVVFWTLYTKVK